jgi:hypothetical protein
MIRGVRKRDMLGNQSSVLIIFPRTLCQLSTKVGDTLQKYFNLKGGLETLFQLETDDQNGNQQWFFSNQSTPIR